MNNFMKHLNSFDELTDICCAVSLQSSSPKMLGLEERNLTIIQGLISMSNWTD